MNKQINIITLIFASILASSCADSNVRDCMHHWKGSLEFYVKQVKDEAIYKAGTMDYREKIKWDDLFENGILKHEHKADFVEASRRTLLKSAADSCRKSSENCGKESIEREMMKTCTAVWPLKPLKGY